MTTPTSTDPELADPAAAPCGFPDLADLDPDTDGVVDPALGHLAAAADYARGAQAGSGAYSAIAAVDALCTAAGAAADIAARTAPYLAAIWPHTEPDLRAAAALLGEANQRLAAARHTTQSSAPHGPTAGGHTDTSAVRDLLN